MHGTLDEAGLVGRVGGGRLRWMWGHVSVVLLGRGAACLGLGEPRRGLLAHVLTVLRWCAADGRVRHWLGVWRRFQVLRVPDGGGTDDAVPRFLWLCACVDRAHASGRDCRLRLLVEKLDL